ncbi:MAG: DUF3786 domain-containing protein [Oscillospiraceae bacterium]|nr:DUF3786 domain-containing protein [Oscillospiraceae bacterium]
MTQRVDNYHIQMQQAKKRFLTYDQQELIQRCGLQFDENYLYTKLLSQNYRIHRRTGDMERFHQNAWVDGNTFNEVMTVLDWLCDSRPDRYITHRWINVVTHGHYFHGNLQEDVSVHHAKLFERQPEAFAAACEALDGERIPGSFVGYAIELIDGLRVLVQLWQGDDEFPPRLRCLWDENTNRYLRYETTWFATALLMQRIKENMP